VSFSSFFKYFLLELAHVYPRSFCSQLECKPCVFAQFHVNLNVNLKYTPEPKRDIRPGPTQPPADPAPLPPHDQHPPRPLLNFHHLRLRSPRNGLRADADGRIHRRAGRILID
jgi:hypothetical protein